MKKKIPPELEPAILARAGKGDGGDAIATWLLSEHGIEVSGRSVRNFLEQKRRDREPLARAVVVEQVARAVTADLTAIDELLQRAQDVETQTGKLDDIIAELERLAKADVGEAFTEHGALKPLKDMPEDVRRAIAGVEVAEIGAGQDGDRVVIGQLRKVRFWDKTRGLELLAKLRSNLAERSAALQAQEQQRRLRELRLRLAGADPGAGGGGGAGGVRAATAVVLLPPERQLEADNDK